MLSENNENGKLQDFALLDVIPLLLGVETTQTRWDSGSDDKHFMLVVIPRNTRVPIKYNVTLFTSVDGNQAVARFSIYEGESSSTLNNYFLGGFHIHDIPPAPARAAKFKLCFDIDENGILSVSAEDMSRR
ncbi:hypothetical protein ACFX15_025335 [Malus domestica]